MFMIQNKEKCILLFNQTLPIGKITNTQDFTQKREYSLLPFVANDEYV